MAFKDFGFYCYNLSIGGAVNYADQLEELTFTTTAPGGYGDLHAKIRVPNAKLYAQRPELQLFARIAVMDGPFPAWQGRIDEPAVVLDTSAGDVLEIHAMGGSDCLKDDPADVSYSGSTAQAILIDQLTNSTLGRNVTLTGTSGWLDSDTSMLLPSNPAGTYFTAYSAYDATQVMNELLASIGDYTWVVWGHPNAQVASGSHVDAAGFPKWALQAHPRGRAATDTGSTADLTTISFIGYQVDEDSYDIRPSTEYSFNAVTLKYRDANTQQPATVTVQDSRLSGFSQGTAPFPWRRFTKDITNITLTSAQATALANAILNDNLNGGSKISLKVAEVRDAQGNLIPLWRVRADSNIFLPELAPLGQQLPTAPTAYTGVQGGNIFYITETEYSEQGGGGQAPTLTITCNSFSDKTTFQFNRLQLQAEMKLRNQTTQATVQAKGASETGWCGVQWGGTALAGDHYGAGVNFKTYLSSAPTSVTFTATTATNATSIAYSNLTVFGFHFNVTVIANGPGEWSGTYKTVGN